MAEELTDAHVVGAVFSPNLATSRTGTRTSARYRWAKELLDSAVAAFVLLLASPLLALIALAIRVDSRGPALFRQQRIGLHGRPFTIYKFRTMFVSAPRYSFKVGIGDRRITRVGRWLRISGLDELPQLLNVLRGEMSLIGPRPELPFIVENFEDWQHARHNVKPGITGWWQIHHRNDVPLHLNLDYDIFYIRNMSYRLDALIAWRTIKIIVAGALTSHTEKGRGL